MVRTIPRGWQELEIKDFLRFTPREVKKPQKRYLSLGIRSHCKGTFVREIEDPDKVMMETLYAVKKDDLIVNITFAWEGAVALVKESDAGALVSHRFPTYVFNHDVVIPEYFRYLIPSKLFIYNLGIISPGGAGRNRVLDRKDFLRLQFILPPLPEQKKIAGILSAWDKAIETLGKLIEAKTDLKKGLMQKLLTGGIRFVKSIVATKYNAGIPKDWKEVYLNDVAQILFSNVDKHSDSNQKPILLCNYIDVYNNSYITRSLNLMPATANEAEIKKFSIMQGDVIITKDSETPLEIGVPSVVLDKFKNVVCGYHLAIIRPNQNIIDSIYLAKQMLAIRTRKQFYKFANGATRYGLGTAEVKKIKILVPSIQEQKKIAETLKTLDRQIKLLTTKLDMLKYQKKGLMQKLLTGKIRVSSEPVQKMYESK